ncbi:hypothetical protein CTI12_AA286300 [Artemisia annua]|uniref:Uncharacterized protein n=1 Tax=Artemisia annua TaxID=35608 RepID=A0A2U1NAS8_ARTAN|nr:hypothetical protein CTI12_AA286300 [Artemisia annua]
MAEQQIDDGATDQRRNNRLTADRLLIDDGLTMERRFESAVNGIDGFDIESVVWR